jgi:multidrug efflux system membrane fusion protein
VTEYETPRWLNVCFSARHAVVQAPAGAAGLTLRGSWWSGLCISSVCAIGAFAFFHLRHRRVASPAPAAVPVTAIRVAAADVPIELEAIGRVTAFNAITVRTLISGQITRIAFRDGQSVEQGDLLVQIDSRLIQAAVVQDKATVQRDRANLANAEADLRRYEPLVGEGIISEQQAQTQRSLVAQLRASVAAEQAARDRDQVQLSYATISAPVAGILGLRLVDVGNVVNPSDPAGLVVLTQVQPITALFALPEASLQEIQGRQAASGRSGLIVQAWTQDGKRELDEGTLSALSTQVDPATGTLTMKALFPNSKQTLWPGSSVSVRLVLDVQHGITVPSTAVDQGPQGPFVWVISTDGIAHSRAVELRQQLHGVSLVSSGLQAGEQVVTDGQYGIASGTRVAVQSRHRSAPAHDLAESARHLAVSAVPT